jgi:hypothetical protein
MGFHPFVEGSNLFTTHILSHKCISFEKEERWCWQGKLGPKHHWEKSLEKIVFLT